MVQINQLSLPRVYGAVAQVRGAQLKNRMLGDQMNRQQRFNALVPDIVEGNKKAVTEGMQVDPERTAKTVQTIREMNEAEREQAKQGLLELGKAVVWADTPDKWNQAIDFLNEQADSDQFEQYRDQFQNREMILNRIKSDAQLFGTEPLQEVYDPESPTGTRYMPRSEAAGQPGKPPSGMEITTPEGTTIRTGVRGGGGGMATRTQGALEEQLAGAQAGIQRLNQIETSFRPEFLQADKKLQAWWTAAKEKGGDFTKGVGLDVSEEEKQFLADYSSFQRDAIDNINRYIKEITGAQMSEAEANRLRKGIPDPERNSPTEFKSRLQSTMKSLRMVAARATFALQHGLSPKTLPLGSMPEMIDNRGAELEAQIRDEAPDMPEDEIRKRVTETLRKEFGL